MVGGSGIVLDVETKMILHSVWGQKIDIYTLMVEQCKSEPNSAPTVRILKTPPLVVPS